MPCNLARNRERFHDELGSSCGSRYWAGVSGYLFSQKNEVSNMDNMSTSYIYGSSAEFVD
jgi:hypothetical protein